ncbi:uncharacterized protein [Malus domestica]|uniref:uncharacterized protein n=1 Tax=Malus domestica TaxID=3750 RepID=UPI003975FF8C
MAWLDEFMDQVGGNKEDLPEPSNFHNNMAYILSAMFGARPDQPATMEDDYLTTEPMMAHVNVEVVEEGEAGKAESTEASKDSPFRIYTDKMVFSRPNRSLANHLKPIYVAAHLECVPFKRILIDEGAAVNVLPAKQMRKMGRGTDDLIPTDLTIMLAFFVVDCTSTYGALLGRDWIHQSLAIPSTLHQQVVVYHEAGIEGPGFWEMVEAESWPFLPTANVVEASFYNPNVGNLKCSGADENGCPTKGRRQERELLDKEEQKWQVGTSTSQHESKEESCREELKRAIQMAECIYDLDGPDDLPESLELVEFLCAEPDKPPPEVQDPLETIDLGTEEDPRPIQISGLLGVDDRAKIICLLQEFKDCFAWHYTEMPGLDSALVEHRMPIKEGYKPVKQTPRRMSKEIEEKVKEKIERLVKAGFIKPAKYVEWLANIVPVLKAVTKVVRCCVDYRNINGATPKDEYPMPMADLSIDAVAKHKVLSFMDGNAGYNQIKMAPEDIHKTAFRCPGHVGAYEYLVMPFGLKNTGATYQRAMNAIFHDLIGQNMEVYIDDIVVKSKTEEQHLEDLRQTLARMRIHKLKMNPKKCAFGVRAGNFLGFLVHQRGVEVDKNKSRAIMESPSPTNKVQLQRLLGKINFLRRFIANLAGKIQPLTPLLRLKDKESFEWGPPHQQAFDSIKAYLTSPPVLVPPQRGKPLKLYISASEKSIGSSLAQNNEGGKEQAVYYLSRILTEVETRYSPVERLCLTLYFTASKLRHYMLPCHVHIIAKTDVIKYMLSKPMLTGRIGKWILALSEFSFQYVPQRAVKGQAIADFLAEHQESQSEVINIPGSLEVTSIWILPRKDISSKEDWVQQEIRRVAGLWITHWKLYFDGSHTQKASGAGIVIVNTQGVYHYYSFLLDYQGNTNNRAEYEALIIGLEILMDLGAVEVEVFGDSELVINQLNGEFTCRHITMAGYYLAATQLLSFWDSEISVNHIPRGSNLAANEMAQLASGVPIQERRYGVDVEVQKRYLPSILERGFSLDVMVLEAEIEDWRSPIIHHLKDPSSPTSKKDRQQATNFDLELVWNSERGTSECSLHSSLLVSSARRAGTRGIPGDEKYRVTQEGLLESHFREDEGLSEAESWMCKLTDADTSR